jgi:hypothetical protein
VNDLIEDLFDLASTENTPHSVGLATAAYYVGGSSSSCSSSCGTVIDPFTGATSLV